MRRRLYILVAVAVLLGLCLLYSLSSTPIGGDISITLIGLTNNPGRSRAPRPYVLGAGSGLHALFAVTNISRRQYLRYGIECVETLEHDGWHTNAVTVARSELGNGIPPNDGYHYAIPWGAGLTTNKPWRLRLWVMRERRLLSLRLHLHGPGRQLLGPYGRHIVTSPVVLPRGLDPADKTGQESS